MDKDLIKNEPVKKATLQDFLAKKAKKEASKNATIDVFVTSMNRTIALKKPSDDRLYEYANSIGNTPDLKVVMEANKELIYDCCSELHNSELHEGLGVKDPYDVMKELFEISDIKEIMNQFNKFIGNRSIVEEIKN